MVFYAEEPPKINYRVPPEDQDASRMSHRTTHEYIRQRHVRYGIIYVHRGTLDMWEFETECEKLRREYEQTPKETRTTR